MTAPKTDIEIAHTVTPRPIREIADDLGIAESDLILYGNTRAKVRMEAIDHSKREPGRLVLMTALTPTPAGEGKTTMSIGLAQGLAKIGKKAALALREPSMGPLFGVKGGATGGGWSQVIPMEDINLHFNGDFPAVAAAHNLLAAALDNAVYHRQLDEFDPRRIVFPRVVDMNDRALRDIVIGLGGNKMGVPRETHYDITAASEVMAILALCSSYKCLKHRIQKILLGRTYRNTPVTAESLKVANAMAILLRDAIHPNLVQSLEGVPAFIHAGPFANIAHGCNSVLATRMAMAHADVTVTEAGFGADLGAEKFFDITCRTGGFAPSAVVVVATVRALKMHGGVSKKQLDGVDAEAVARGMCNLEKHVENMGKFAVPTVVAINRFTQDDPSEHEVIVARCKALGVKAVVADVHGQGGAGATDLAQAVVDAMSTVSEARLKPLYELEWSPEKKIETIAREIYGAEGVEYTTEGKRHLRGVYKLGYDKLAVCIAKTQSSFSDDPTLLGRPEGFTITVRGIEIAAGAEFIVPLTGDILRMPGLPKDPAFLDMDLADDGSITGLS